MYLYLWPHSLELYPYSYIRGLPFYNRGRLERHIPKTRTKPQEVGARGVRYFRGARLVAFVILASVIRSKRNDSRRSSILYPSYLYVGQEASEEENPKHHTTGSERSR